MTRFTMIMVAVLVTGCASNQAFERQLAEQQEVIRDLQARLLVDDRDPRPSTDESDADAVEAAPERRVATSRSGIRPMPAFTDTPQTWGNLHGAPPVRGVCPQSLTLRLYNRMDNHVVVQLDGRNVQVGGATSVLPTLPPGQMVEVCLSRYGRHTIAGQVVTFREGQPVRGERFSDPDVHFGSDPSGVIPYHRYGITGQIVRRHRIR